MGEGLLVVYHRANIRSEGFVGLFPLEVRGEKEQPDFMGESVNK